MKKTDFPDKCSACRLLNRDKMRAALESKASKKKDAPAQFAVTVVEDKKGKGPKIKAPKKNPEEAKQEEPETTKPKKFEKLVKEGDKVFPDLPPK
jgi:hypothetical protein